MDGVEPSHRGTHVAALATAATLRMCVSSGNPLVKLADRKECRSQNYASCNFYVRTRRLDIGSVYI